MTLQTVRPDLVKFEMRQTTGRPAWQAEVKKPGFFARLLSGVGKFFGAIAAPLSFIFPPAALGKRNPENVSFPGLDLGGFGGIQPASGVGISPKSAMIMDVLFARDGASLSMAHRI